MKVAIITFYERNCSAKLDNRIEVKNMKAATIPHIEAVEVRVMYYCY